MFFAPVIAAFSIGGLDSIPMLLTMWTLDVIFLLEAVRNFRSVRMSPTPMEDYPLEAWLKLLTVNLTSVFLLTQTIGRRSMIPRRHGKVLNVASIAGLRGNRPDEGEMIGYNTTKGGLVNFTRTLAAEWGEHSINVNALAPGFFETKMTRGLLAKVGDALTAHAPLGRLGDEEDLKGPAVLLCSEAGKHITGQILAVDGGVMAA
jgi:gluconate 5-dehydrogenase